VRPPRLLGPAGGVAHGGHGIRLGSQLSDSGSRADGRALTPWDSARDRRDRLASPGVIRPQSTVRSRYANEGHWIMPFPITSKSELPVILTEKIDNFQQPDLGTAASAYECKG
jgi:hypothetical protein